MKPRKESVEIGWGRKGGPRATMERSTLIDGQLYDRLYAKPFTYYFIEVL